MTTFRINEHIEIACEWKKTRMAFKHVATLLRDGHQVDSTKICYQNRTWERYEFESVLYHLIDKTKVLTQEEKEEARDYVKNYQENDGELKRVGMLAALGDIFGQTTKEKNDWKARMLKAGLENKGLIMPDDWNELDEETKEARLNAAIAQIR